MICSGDTKLPLVLVQTQLCGLGAAAMLLETAFS